jgi:hypothetical protein
MNQDSGDYAGVFLRAYIHAAFWSSPLYDEEGVEEGTLLESGNTEADLAPDALESMRQDCEAFISSAGDDLVGMDPEQAGHDFWLTRNRHGAGFWDRGLGERGDRLTALAHPYGESTLYLDDEGRVHVE